MRKFICVIFPLFLMVFLLNSCGAKKKMSQSSTSTNNKTEHKRTDKTNLKDYYASLLNTNPKNLNENLYIFIDKWMGKPHRLGGTTPEGIDCSQFVNYIYKEVYQKNLPRTSRDMGDIVKRKYDDQLKEGDLVFFSFGGKNIDHVGVYLHNDKFVHVSTKQGVVVSNLKDTWYYKYLTRCGTPEI